MTKGCPRVKPRKNQWARFLAHWLPLRWCCQPYSCLWPSLGIYGGNLSSVSITIISAMLFSVVVALTLTPALCGSVLQHVPPHKKGFFGAFNRFYRRTEDKYQRGVIYVLRRAARTMGLYLVLGGGMALIVEIARAVYPLKTRAKSWCSTRCRRGDRCPYSRSESPDC